jgi:hypothetical protein
MYRPQGAGRVLVPVAFARGAICACCRLARDLASSAVISSNPSKVPACLEPLRFHTLNDPSANRIRGRALSQPPHNRTCRGDKI